MPGKIQVDSANRKRKRIDPAGNSLKEDKPRKALKKQSSDGQNAQSDVLLLEEQITASTKHYNNIAKLQEILSKYEKKPKLATFAAVSLCRVFSRLIAGEKLVSRSPTHEGDDETALWLRERLKEYTESLIAWLGSDDATQEGTALTLLMRIVKEETSQGTNRVDVAWRSKTGTFNSIVKALLNKTSAESARAGFIEKYLEEHDDVRFYTFLTVKHVLAERDLHQEERVSNAIDLLSRVEGVPDSEDQLEDWYGDEPNPANKQIRSLHVHHKMAQEAWLAIFRSDPNSAQRKSLLSLLNSHILPWFVTRVEMLVDFLTDSFNAGGTLSLLALSGIFHLMANKNLDYPDFYTKLYSLLDENLLHSKHRSRFFRLLEKFMSSSHLPAVMVASFLKRLARLALQAPPSAIVFIIPWTYNMLKQHPACTFMIHRVYHPGHAVYKNNPNYEEEGMDDPFDMAQVDPILTGAIDSSLWELETLQSHYHPNVATLAKILSEQFTKREYQLEDFLDHSYTTLIDAELNKPMKKDPVVEWEIPKHIISSEDGTGGLNAIGTLLQHALDSM